MANELAVSMVELLEGYYSDLDNLEEEEMHELMNSLTYLLLRFANEFSVPLSALLLGLETASKQMGFSVDVKH